MLSAPRQAQLRQLRGQVKIALDIGAVHDVEYRVGLLVDEVIPGNDFLQRVGRKGVYARQVLYDNVLMPLQLALFLLDGDAGPVTHIL
jgi:hypothetical protein